MIFGVFWMHKPRRKGRLKDKAKPRYSNWTPGLPFYTLLICAAIFLMSSSPYWYRRRYSIVCFSRPSTSCTVSTAFCTALQICKSTFCFHGFLVLKIPVRIAIIIAKDWRRYENLQIRYLYYLRNNLDFLLHRIRTQFLFHGYQSVLVQSSARYIWQQLINFANIYYRI